MKKSFLCIFAIFIIALFIISSCKKDKNEISSTGTEIKMSPEEIKVLGFIEKYQQKKNNVLKEEGDPVSVEDAIWYWNAVFNYRHGEPTAYLEQVQLDTVYIDFPNLNNNGDLSESDLLTTYSEIIAQARDRYISIELDDKKLKSVQIKIDNSSKSGNSESLEIVLATGSNKNPENTNTVIDYGTPFKEGDNWSWNYAQYNAGGKCDPETGEFLDRDATTELTRVIWWYDNKEAILGNYSYCIVRDDLFEIATVVENVPLPIYAPSGLPTYTGLFQLPTHKHPTCIHWEDMNFYYNNIMTATHDNGFLSNYNDLPYFSLIVQANEIVSTKGLAYHWVLAQYAETYKVYNHITIPLQDEK